MGRKVKGTIGFLSDHLDGLDEAIRLIAVISLILTLPEIALPFINQTLIDTVLSGVNIEWGLPIIIFAAVICTIKVVMSFVECSNWKHRLRMSTSSSSEMFWHILRLPVGFFHDRYSADLTNRIYYGRNMADSILDRILFLVKDFACIFLYLYFMIRYNAFLTVFALIHIFTNLFVLRSVHSRQVGNSRTLRKETDNLQGVTSTGIENIDSLKGASAEPVFFQMWSESFSRMQGASTVCTSKNIRYESVPLILDAFTRVIVLAVGTYYVMSGFLTVGMLMTFQSFMSASLKPMSHIVSGVQNVADVKAQAERMNEILQAECDVPDSLEFVAEPGSGKLKGNVELRHVTFGYDRSAPALIEDFSMVLPAGKSVAFVGPSGCGKSTIAKLVSGLYKPWSGEILFDGKPQDEINRDVFANSVSIVDQNIVMFDGSIADNVKLWDDSLEDFAMIFACHDAQIHEEIVVRDGNYNAQMESGGKNFSGGQRQRIELASAFVKEPALMIMDEGTSALDAVTEENVMRSIRNMGCSQIIIAHRLSTIRDCDEIIVMRSGKIMERGSHSELIASGGFYSQLIDNR